VSGPPALEWQVPEEPAALWVARALQALALWVLLHWGYGWARALHDEATGFMLLTGCGLTVSLWCLVRRRKSAAAASQSMGRTPRLWCLRFDGETWHWCELDGDREGRGTLSLAAEFGPWSLLRALAARGQGRSAWIWMRPARVHMAELGSGAPAPGAHLRAGTRLRTLLHWT